MEEKRADFYDKMGHDLSKVLEELIDLSDLHHLIANDIYRRIAESIE